MMMIAWGERFAKGKADKLQPDINDQATIYNARQGVKVFAFEIIYMLQLYATVDIVDVFDRYQSAK